MDSQLHPGSLHPKCVKPLLFIARILGCRPGIHPVCSESPMNLKDFQLQGGFQDRALSVRLALGPACFIFNISVCQFVNLVRLIRLSVVRN